MENDIGYCMPVRLSGDLAFSSFIMQLQWACLAHLLPATDSLVVIHATMSYSMIGVGIMGRGMALNLLASGRQLVIWNRTASKCDELKAKGATVVATPADVVEQASVTYSMVRDRA